jgi:hypothetical protein
MTSHFLEELSPRQRNKPQRSALEAPALQLFVRKEDIQHRDVRNVTARASVSNGVLYPNLNSGEAPFNTVVREGLALALPESEKRAANYGRCRQPYRPRPRRALASGA